MAAMKTLVSLVALALITSASAQVTLTKPEAPAKVNTPEPITTPQTKTKAKTTTSSVPEGWYEVRGRIFTKENRRMSMPAGTQVRVVLEDSTARKNMLDIKFKTRSLPTSYYMYVNPARLKQNHSYLLRASIIDPQGVVTYMTYTPVAYEMATKANIDLPIVPAN